MLFRLAITLSPSTGSMTSVKSINCEGAVCVRSVLRVCRQVSVPQCLHLCAGGSKRPPCRVAVAEIGGVCPVLKWGGPGSMCSVRSRGFYFYSSVSMI